MAERDIQIGKRLSIINEQTRVRMNAELREYVHCAPTCSCRTPDLPNSGAST